MVTLGTVNGGIITNISESGLGLKSVGPVPTSRLTTLRFELPGTRAQVQASGTVIWSDAAGQAGVYFVDLPTRFSQDLKNWMAHFEDYECMKRADSEAEIENLTNPEPHSVRLSTKSLSSGCPAPDSYPRSHDTAAERGVIGGEEERKRHCSTSLSSVTERATLVSSPDGNATAQVSAVPFCAAAPEIPRCGDARSEIKLLKHFSSRQDERNLLCHVANQTMLSLRADGIAIAYYSDGSIVCMTSCGEIAPQIGSRLNVNAGITAQCLREGTPLQCYDTQADQRVNSETCHKIGIRSLLVVPLRRNSELIGVASVFYAKPRGFPEWGLRELERASSLFVKCISHQWEPILHDANYDTQNNSHLQNPDLVFPVSVEHEKDVRTSSFSPSADEHLGLNFGEESLGSDVSRTTEPLSEMHHREPPSNPGDIAKASSKMSLVSGQVSEHENSGPEERVPSFWTPAREFDARRPLVVASGVVVFCALLLGAWHVRMAYDPKFKQGSQGTSSASPNQRKDFTNVQSTSASGLGSDDKASISQLLHKAASGDAQAQLRLAQRYEQGNGVRRDLVNACMWYILSGEVGRNASAKEASTLLTSKMSPSQIGRARLNVGRMYAKGIGTNQDYVAAFTWFVLAEAAGDLRAKGEQSRLAGLMRSQEMARAQSRASAWLKSYSSQR